LFYSVAECLGRMNIAMRGLRGWLSVCCALLLIVACCSADEQGSGAAAAGDSKQKALLTLDTDSFSATIEQQTAPALVGRCAPAVQLRHGQSLAGIVS
jgi:hypothetical protein